VVSEGPLGCAQGSWRTTLDFEVVIPLPELDERALADLHQADRATVLRAFAARSKEPLRLHRWYTHAQLPPDPRCAKALTWGGSPWDAPSDPLSDIALLLGSFDEQDLRRRALARKVAWLEGHGYEGTELAAHWIAASRARGGRDPRDPALSMELTTDALSPM
jgi:hypothetical protein